MISLKNTPENQPSKPFPAEVFHQTTSHECHHHCHAQGHELGGLGVWIVCLLLGISSIPLGVFLILRRMTLMADGLSHSMFPGVALATCLWGPSLWASSLMGCGFSVLMVGSTLWLAKKSRLSQDALFSGLSLASFALGLLVAGPHQDPHMHTMMGSTAHLEVKHFYLAGALALGTWLFLMTQKKALIASSFDPLFFRLQGGDPSRLNAGFWMAVTVNIMMSIQVLGTLLGLGLMILPPLVALLVLKRSLFHIVYMALLIGGASCLAGSLLAGHTLEAVGSWVVFILGLFFVLALFLEWIHPGRCKK